MPRCAVATRASAVPTSLRGPSVYATTGITPRIVRVEVYNTTSTAMAVGLAIASATGTPGAGLTEVALNDRAYVPIATGFNTHTVDATVGACIVQGDLAGIVGSAIIWTFDVPITLSAATTSGLVIVTPTGTGQIIDFAIHWDE